MPNKQPGGGAFIGAKPPPARWQKIPLPEVKKAAMSTQIVDPARQFRGTSAWKRARAAVMAKARRDGSPCALCGEPIAWNAPRLHPLGPTVDHRRPLKTIDLSTAAGRELAVDRTLLQIAHRRCNSARENNSRGRARVVVSPQPPAADAELDSRVLPVCNGRACTCAWMGDGVPRTDCPTGPPAMVLYERTANGWVAARAQRYDDEGMR
jgi:5-methylcytosine-specific restriction endonuclease McrA